jgi:hypothetical protein
MATRMQQRRGTAAQWISTNSGNGPILNAGEIGFETDTNKFKIGDGTNHWINLDYFIDASSTVNPAFGSSITFEGATANDFETTLAITDPTADRTITFPDASGTVVLADGSGNVTVSGDLTVSGTTTTINSTTINATTGIVFEGATANEFETTLAVTDPTQDRTLTLPNSTGTIATEEYVDGAISGAAFDPSLAAGTGIEWNGTSDQYDIDSTVTTNDGTQTLTNKTLTSPTVSGLTLSDSGIVIEGSSADAHETTLTVTNPTADRTITFPDETGTVQLRVTDVSDTEIAYLNGVTSAIQTQLDNKQAVVANVSNTEIGYLDGVTSAIQTQLNSKQKNLTTGSGITLNTGTPTYAIGDTGPAGGIIFIVPSSQGGLGGTEYYEAWTTDTSQLAWSSNTTTALGASYSGIGGGKLNTALIPGGASAACKDTARGGFSDWFMPSEGELNQLYTHRAAIGGFGNFYYWSSTQAGSFEARAKYFVTGDVISNGRFDTLRTRPIRSFDENTIVEQTTISVNTSTIQARVADVSDTEIGYLNGVTSAIQTQMDAKAPLAGPALTGDATAVNLTVSGNLTVNGTTTNINSTNLVVEDKNIVLGDAASPTDTTADGGGITLKGATDKTFNWVDATDAWTSSEHINLASGKTLKYDGTDLVAAQSGNSGKYLTTDGTSTSWGTVSGYSAPTLGSTSIASGATVTTISGLTDIVLNGPGSVTDELTLLLMGAI